MRGDDDGSAAPWNRVEHEDRAHTAGDGAGAGGGCAFGAGPSGNTIRGGDAGVAGNAGEVVVEGEVSGEEEGGGGAGRLDCDVSGVMRWPRLGRGFFVFGRWFVFRVHSHVIGREAEPEAHVFAVPHDVIRAPGV